MAQLIVRNLDSKIVRALKKRAAAQGRSAEAEHREILRGALFPLNEGLKSTLLAIPAGGTDADFERHDDRGRDVKL